MKGKEKRPPPPRAVEVGRDSLKTDNKNLTVLRAAALNYEEITQTKTALLSNNITGTPAEIRQRIGLLIRAWNKEWKLSILGAILQEVMGHRDFTQGGLSPLLGICYSFLTNDISYSGPRIRPVPCIHRRK